jgi:hypothetical protein
MAAVMVIVEHAQLTLSALSRREPRLLLFMVSVDATKHQVLIRLMNAKAQTLVGLRRVTPTLALDLISFAVMDNATLTELTKMKT